MTNMRVFVAVLAGVLLAGSVVAGPSHAACDTSSCDKKEETMADKDSEDQPAPTAPAEGFSPKHTEPYALLDKPWNGAVPQEGGWTDTVPAAVVKWLGGAREWAKCLVSECK